jgi:hypothetical protein
MRESGMRGKAGVACESSIAERAGVRAAMLRKGRQGKRDESDCGPKHHGTILDRIRNSREELNWVQGPFS